MPATRDDIRIRQGAAYRRVYEFIGVDLTGSLFRSQVRAAPGSDVLLDLASPPVDGSGITAELAYTDDGRPVTTVTVVAQDDLTALMTPGFAVHDIKVTYPNDEDDYLVEGKALITEQVTE